MRVNILIVDENDTTLEYLGTGVTNNNGLFDLYQDEANAWCDRGYYAEIKLVPIGATTEVSHEQI